MSNWWNKEEIAMTRKRGIADCTSLVSRFRAESGQALVELAVSISLLFLILLAAVEFGRATYAAIEVSNAAKAAVQYGAMNGGPVGDTAGILNAIQGDSFNLGNTVTISAGYPTVSNACSDGSTYSATTGCTNSHLLRTLTVKTETTFQPLIGWQGFPTSFKLYGYAQQLVLQ
jgi:Flp pilus assembly protein TadG